MIHYKKPIQFFTGKVYRKEEKYITPDGITHDTIAVKSIISWEGEKKWLLATRWDITQLKNYERELVAAKEELEKAFETEEQEEEKE